MTGDVNWISINTFCVECISSEFRDVDWVRRIIRISFSLFFFSRIRVTTTIIRILFYFKIDRSCLFANKFAKNCSEINYPLIRFQKDLQP